MPGHPPGQGHAHYVHRGEGTPCWSSCGRGLTTFHCLHLHLCCRVSSLPGWFGRHGGCLHPRCLQSLLHHCRRKHCEDTDIGYTTHLVVKGFPHGVRCSCPSVDRFSSRQTAASQSTGTFDRATKSAKSRQQRSANKCRKLWTLGVWQHPLDPEWRHRRNITEWNACRMTPTLTQPRATH